MAATSWRRERRPDRGLVQDPHAGQQRRLAQDGAVAELPVEGRRIGLVRGRQRLEILPAGMQALVGHDHVGAGQRPARAPPTGRPGPRRPPARRRRSPAQARRARLAAAPATGAERTSMPSATLVRQARWLGRPSTVTRQSKQTPMPQNGPRGAPEPRLADGDDVGGRERGGDGLARQRLDLGDRRSGGGPARRPAACRGASGAWQKVYNAKTAPANVRNGIR